MAGFGPLNTNILGVDLQNYTHLNYIAKTLFIYLFYFILFYKGWGVTQHFFSSYRLPWKHLKTKNGAFLFSKEDFLRLRKKISNAC